MNNPPRSTPFKISYQGIEGRPHSQEFQIPTPRAFSFFPTTAAGARPTKPGLGDWSMLAGRGDEWFETHLRLSLPPHGGSLVSPWLFSAGHAVELYLKAAVALTANLTAATKFGHKLGDLWKHCESLPGFPLRGLVREHLLAQDLDLYSQTVRQNLPPDDAAHVAEHELLYLSMRHVQDLKYLGTPGATTRKLSAITFGTGVPNRPMIHTLGRLARWTWGPWCCQPGYNNPQLFEFANRLLG